jgi:hypothetical protein
MPALAAYAFSVARIREQCSFCGKRKDQVRKLIAGPGVFICNRCVELCNEVLSDDAHAAPGAAVYCSSARRTGVSSWFRNLFKVHSYRT